MFLTFGINAMHQALTAVAAGTVIRDINEEALSHAREVIFAVPTAHPKVTLLVYTSYSPYKAESRDYAKDSVKFVLRYVGKTETRYVGNYKRVFRNSKNGDESAFLKKVREEVAVLLKMATPVRVCACGGLMVPRYVKAKGRWFMGCMNYPNCPKSAKKSSEPVAV